MDRRRFLGVAATSAAAGSAISCSRAGDGFRVLAAAEAAALTAMANQIIPPDDFPGAGDAGFASYVDRQLAGPYAHWREAYRAGIAELDEACRSAKGRPFAELGAEAQLEMLKAREKSSFFEMVRDHAMQSYYGDARHGGNPDNVSWKMLGIPHPPVRGREQYDLTAKRTS